jgi:iron complex outermembrane recepter protein
VTTHIDWFGLFSGEMAMQKRIGRILTLVGLLGVASLVHAQVEEITVTAERREANLQEVPVSVSAFTADDIGELQMDTAQDISAAVPNMQMYTVTANASAMQVYMRGAGVQNPGFNASESPVGIYVDDIYRGRLATANLDLADIERIEVLRGPQGTLYGRNTIAGAVKFITRTPEDEYWANASVGAGDFATTKYTGSIGSPLIDGKLAGSVTGLYHRRNEGWIERGDQRTGDTGAPISDTALGEYNNLALRSKLHWYEGDVFDAVLALGYVNARNDGYNAIPYGPDFNPPTNPGEAIEGFYDTLVPDATTGYGKTTQKDTSLNLSWALEPFTVRSITGYSDIDDDFEFDLNGGAFQCNDDPVFCDDTQGPLLVGVPGFFVDSSSNNKTFSQEFNLAGDSFDDRLTWLAGVFYMHEDGEQLYQGLVNFAAPFDPVFLGSILAENVETTTDSYAIYGEGTWAFTDKLDLTLGVRWTQDDKSYDNTCNGNLCAPDGTWTVNLDKDFDEVTPRVILEYQWIENLMVFGSVSQGFQAGGFQTLCFGNQSCNEIIYDPQTVTSWETGVKTDWLDNTLRVNVSAFYAQYEDVQQSVVSATSGFPLINAGDVDVTGFELETNWAPNDIFNAFLIYGYGNEDFDSATTALLNTERLPGLPRNSARVGFEVQVPAFSGWDWLFSADVNYVDDYLAALTANPTDQLTIDSYTRLNGRFGLLQPDGHWSGILSATNITDEEDLYSGIVGSGTNIRTPQPPREWMFTVNYTY